MTKSIFSQTLSATTSLEFDSMKESQHADKNYMDWNEPSTSENSADFRPKFDFLKYMYAIHYRLERKLVGTTLNLKKGSKSI